jgi:methionine-S-sulfoxide reductase
MRKAWAMLAGLLMIGSGLLADPLQNQANSPASKFEKATFAGGCFWCMQPLFDKIPGVIKTVVGYTGGSKVNPTYEGVSSGITGHAESIDITFDPKRVTYDTLLDVYWRNIDPTQMNGQFVDTGTQYRTVIFYHSTEQKKVAEASKDKLAKSGRFKDPIVTQILQAMTFYPAEEHHQQYYKKCPLPYKAYHTGSGRDDFINSVWGTKK